MNSLSVRPIVRLFLLSVLLISATANHCKNKKAAPKRTKIPGLSESLRCRCGMYDLSQPKLLRRWDICTPTRGHPQEATCETTGVCRKKLIKIPGSRPGQGLSAHYDCVSPEELRNDRYSGRHPTPVPVECTTLKWWEEAVGCCRSDSWCNAHINITIVHNSSDITTEGVSWGFPCDVAAQCALLWEAPDHQRLCVEKFIYATGQRQKVCCAAQSFSIVKGMSPEGCCGADTHCDSSFQEGFPGHCKCVDRGVATTTTMVTRPTTIATQIRCSCGYYRASDSTVTHDGVHRCRGDRNDGYCDTYGLCRKRVVKQVNGEFVTELDCVDARNSGPVSILHHPYNAIPQYYLSRCTTQIDTWWDAAVGCCKNESFCNKKLRVEIGGVFANTIFLASSYPVPLVHDTSIPGMREASLIRFGYPCERTQQCAMHPYHRYCVRKWIGEIKRIQGICCSILNHGKIPYPESWQIGIGPEACCGSSRICEPTHISGRCKCVDQPGIKFDGAECRYHSDCANQRCEFNPQDKKVCCSATGIGDFCSPIERLDCCFGRECVEKKCVERALLADGEFCLLEPEKNLKLLFDAGLMAAKGALCKGGLCMQRTSYNRVFMNGLFECCSKVIGEPCEVDNNCCGYQLCKHGICVCAIPEDDLSQFFELSAQWGSWLEYRRDLVDACAPNKILKNRARDETGPYCPSRQFANLQPYSPPNANYCPDPNQIRAYKGCTIRKSMNGFVFGYLGCMKPSYHHGEENHMWILNQSIEFKPMSPRICIQYCSTRGVPYKYAGTHANVCGCAKEILTYSPIATRIAPESHCNWVCNAETMAFCGGPGPHFSVYCTPLGNVDE